MSDDPYDTPHESSPPPGYAPAGGLPPDRSEAASKKLAAGLCGILLGGFGVHKFILGYNSAGAIMLAVTLATFAGTIATCGITAPLCIVMGVIGLAEGIIYLTKSDDDFYQTYMVGTKEWF